MSDRAAIGRRSRRRGYEAELAQRKVYEAAGALVARFATSRGIEFPSGRRFGDLLVLWPGGHGAEIVEVKTAALTPKEWADLDEAKDMNWPSGIRLVVCERIDGLIIYNEVFRR
jgi:hypothetical protein